MTDASQRELSKFKAVIVGLERQLREAMLKYRRAQHEVRALQIENRRLAHELEYHQRRQRNG